MNVTATGHIRKWMQPLMGANAHGRKSLWTEQKMNVTALVRLYHHITRAYTSRYFRKRFLISVVFLRIRRISKYSQLLALSREIFLAQHASI